MGTTLALGGIINSVKICFEYLFFSVNNARCYFI